MVDLWTPSGEMVSWVSLVDLEGKPVATQLWE
jgi:hypothetical protein